MPFSSQTWSSGHVETLLAMGTTLADLTQSMETARGIPGYVSEALALEPITLAVVRMAADDAEPQVLLHAASGALSEEGALAEFRPVLVGICKEIGAASSAHAFHAAMAVPAFSEIHVSSLPICPRALLFTRTIDAQHRLVLLVHQRVTDLGLSTPMAEALVMLSTQLAKLFNCLLAWNQGPQVLGGAFARLTEREWSVLQGLNSDDGEKQLADRLSLSPHTLHSHIKSIYRKVGVQGRLPLLLRLQEALRQLRTTMVNSRRTGGHFSIGGQRPEPAAMAG